MSISHLSILQHKSSEIHLPNCASDITMETNKKKCFKNPRVFKLLPNPTRLSFSCMQKKKKNKGEKTTLICMRSLVSRNYFVGC